jgi:hypothetical protein
MKIRLDDLFCRKDITTTLSLNVGVTKVILGMKTQTLILIHEATLFISRLMLAKSSDKNQMNFSNNNNDEVKMKNRRNKL